MSDWRDDARCLGADTDLFYPEPKTGRGTDDSLQYVLNTFCRRCTVATICLEKALEEERTYADRVGIRGGLTAAERRRLAKAGAA
jgi:WhiB family redox-sensing transcriptional regulator